MTSQNYFRTAYFTPDIACLVAAFQNGHYRDVLAMARLVIPPHLTRDTFPRKEYAAVAATLDPWLSEYGLTRLPRLLDGLDDMHMIMLLHAAYSGRVDVVQQALEILSVTSAMMMLMVDVAAWNNKRPVLDYLVSLPHHDDWTCSSFALIAASKGGHVDIVRFLHEKFPLVPTTEDAMDMAAAEGHLDVVRYLHAHRPEGCTTRAMDGAAKNGYLDVLRFLHANRSEGCTQNAMDWACERGHLEVAQWLYEHRRWEGVTENAFNGAAANNHLSVVEFLHHVVRAPSTIKATDRAAAAGHWAMVQWIHDHRSVTGWTDKALVSAAAGAQVGGHVEAVLPTQNDEASRDWFKAAVESGDVEAIERLVSQFPGKLSLADAMSAATKADQVNVVRWLLNRGVRPPSIMDLVRDASLTGRLNVVKFLYQHRPSATVELHDRSQQVYHSALDNAAWFGHLNVVEWLHARWIPATKAAMNGAALGGHLRVLRWLHKHRKEGCTQAAMNSAASNGDFSIVRWLIRHRLFDSISDAIPKAAGRGDLVMLEFMYNNRSEPVFGGDHMDQYAMDLAAEGGHLGILRFLHARQVVCTDETLYHAVKNGHFHVAKWLHATYHCEVTQMVLAGAIRNGDLVCMRWLLTIWQGDAPAVDFEEVYPPLTMLQFLLEMGCTCSAESMDFAASSGHLAPLIKMHEFGTTCTSNAMRGAADYRHVDVVRWLFANRTEGCAEGAITDDDACWDSVMKYMVNEVVPETQGAILEAAQRGDLKIVKWLHQRGNVDMASVVAWATHHPESDTAQWILNNATSRKRRKIGANS